jgi:MFS transporter, ACS family, glucarate transporter
MKPTAVRWLVFVLGCAVSWLLYLHRYAWGVVKPAIKEEFPSLTDVQMGWLDSAFNASYAVGQVPGGMAGDRYGPRAVLSLLILLWSAGLAALTAGNGFWSLAGLRAWFGLAQAGAYPSLSQVTRSWFPTSVRTTVQGAMASLAGRAGGACASLVVAAWLMGLLGLSWQKSLLILGAAGLAVGVAFWLLFRDRPALHPWVNEEERYLIEGPKTAASEKPAAVKLSLAGANKWTLAALLLYASASTFADQLYVFWVPQFLVEGKRMGSTDMGLFAGLPLWGGAFGGALGGVLNDVFIRATGSRRLGRAGVALTGKLLAALLIAVSVTVADGRLVMLVLLACKFFGDWSLASQWGAITDVAGPAAGTVFGAVNTAGSVAAFAAGPIMGYLKQQLGWETLFLTVAGTYALAACCWLLIDSDRRLIVNRDSGAEKGP